MLLLAGEYDVGLPPRNAAEYAGLSEHAALAVQPGAGHFPWLDDPAWFTRDTGGLTRLTASSSILAATVAPSVRIVPAMAVARARVRGSGPS